MEDKNNNTYSVQFVFFIILLNLLLSSSVLALEIEAAYGKRQGEITFQIGGQITLDSGETGRLRFPLSELRFATNTSIINFQLSHLFNNNWLASASASKNITLNSGEMKDSDWGINYYFLNREAFPRDSLDIYSESRLTLDAVDLKLELQKKLTTELLSYWNVFIGGGILFQRYQFKAFDTVQSYPSTPEKPADILTGKTITYRYEARMPFASVMLTRNFNPKIAITFAIAYSPWLKVTDHDNHILRKKISTGNSDGWGTTLNASLNYLLQKSTSVFASVVYLKTVANGIQTQKFSANEEISTAEIGLRNTNEQKIIMIGISHSF